MPFIRVTIHWEKGNTHIFEGLFDTVSELMLIPEDPKISLGPPIKVQPYGSQMVNGVFTQVYITMDPVGLQIHPVVIALLLEYIIRIDMLNYWQNHHIISLTYKVKAIVVGRAK